jgi:hypothetical protein
MPTAEKDACGDVRIEADMMANGSTCSKYSTLKGNIVGDIVKAIGSVC